MHGVFRPNEAKAYADSPGGAFFNKDHASGPQAAPLSKKRILHHNSDLAAIFSGLRVQSNIGAGMAHCIIYLCANNRCIRIRGSLWKIIIAGFSYALNAAQDTARIQNQ